MMQSYLIAFVIGGLICVLGQLLMDLTALTPAHILVLFVVLGGVLSGMGFYQPFVEFAGAGASIPLPGFGHTLVSGTFEGINKIGPLGIFSGALKAAATGLTSAVVFGYLMSILFNPKG